MFLWQDNKGLFGKQSRLVLKNDVGSRSLLFSVSCFPRFWFSSAVEHAYTNTCESCDKYLLTLWNSHWPAATYLQVRHCRRSHKDTSFCVWHAIDKYYFTPAPRYILYILTWGAFLYIGEVFNLFDIIIINSRRIGRTAVIRSEMERWIENGGLLRRGIWCCMRHYNYTFPAVISASFALEIQH